MADASCLFCKIIDRKISSSVIFETEDVLGFNDIHPQAPVHALFIPKRHIADVQQLAAGDGTVDRFVNAANQSARQMKLDAGYRLVINCRADGGQTVDHLHLHLLGGRKMTWPPG